MTLHQPRKLEREAIKLLKESKLPYSIKPGKKHAKVYIGDEMVCVLARESSGGRDTLLLQRIIRQRLTA